MDSDSRERQRETASQIARQKVLNAMKSSGQTEDDLTRMANVFNADEQAAADEYVAKNAEISETTGTFKDSETNQKSIDDNWSKYHSAWQQYYQNYYNNYYSQAAQSYISTEKMKAERTKANRIHQARNWRILAPIIAVIVLALTGLFMQYNRLIFAPIMAYVAPSDNMPTSIEAVDPTITQAVSAEPRLIIPKINVDVPVEFGIHYNDVMDAMNSGVAQFSIPGANAMPGEIGNLVITGHSAGDIYSSNPYKFIFSGLERLENGDLIYVNYNSVRYTYQMVRSEVVEPTNVQALIYETNKPMLTLITCTPLGTSRYRLLITAEQIAPSYENANTQSSSNSGITSDPVEETTMPSNEATFFERVRNWLFGS